jgi:hypothetical protein
MPDCDNCEKCRRYMDTRNKINRERYENDPEYRKKKQEYARERMRIQREKKKAQKVEEAK